MGNSLLTKHKTITLRIILALALLAGSLARPALAQTQFVTNHDSNQVPQSTPKSGNVLVNDDNPNNLAIGTFSISLVSGPLHGSIAGNTINANGSYTYTPTGGYVGADSFTYQICYPAGSSNCSNVSTVALNVYDPTLACTQGTGPNLLQNPSFNSGNVGFTSGYTFVPTPSSTPSLYAEGTYAIGNNARTYHPDFNGTGHTADNFMIVNGAAALQSVYLQAVTVFPNRFYTISVWATSVHPSSPAQLGLVVAGKSTSVVTTLPSAVNQYVQLSDLYFSGPGPASGWQVSFEIRDINKSLGGNDFGIDDVYFGSCSTDLLADTKTNP
ncbi:MAG: hypothetical protein EOO63_12375, partial [Hymenobacter sp.]